MFKKQLIELLDLQLIDKNNKEEIEFILQLNQREINILLNNKKRALYLYKLMKALKNTHHYKYIMERAIKIENIDLLEQFVLVGAIPCFIESSNYRFIMEKVLQIKDPILLSAFITIAYDRTMMKDSKYKTRLNSICNLNFTHMEMINTILYIDTINDEDKVRFIDIICKFKDENILKQLLSVLKVIQFEKMNSDEICSMFDLIIEKIKSKNINEILQFILEGLNDVKKTIEYRQMPITDIIEKNISDRNIVNIISSSCAEEIVENLNDIPDNEDITSDTFVKKIVK